MSSSSDLATLQGTQQKHIGTGTPLDRGNSSDKTHLTAVKILSCILEDYGPASVPISQGWLALVLSEILGDNKAQSSKGTTQPEPEKVKVLISFISVQNIFWMSVWYILKILSMYTYSHSIKMDMF